MPATPKVETAEQSSPSPLVLLEWLLIPVGLAIILLALPHNVIGDDGTRVRMLESVLEFHRTIPVKYSLAGPILAAPLWFIGKMLGNPVAGLLFYDWLLFCGALVAFYFLLRRRWAAEPLRHFLLLLVAGSMFGRHLLHFGAEAFTNTMAGVGLAAVGVGLGRWGWVVTVVGSVNTPATQPALVVAALRWAWEKRRLRYLLIPAASASLILIDTWLRMGSPFVTGYENDHGMRTFMPYSGLPNLSYPMFFGLLGLTFSFGKGLMYFASGLLAVPWMNRLGLPDRMRAVLRLWLSFTLGLLFLYSTYWAWYGGVSAGPRYLLFASFPATLLLAQLLATPSPSWVGSLGRLAILAMSCWTAVATTVFEQGGVDACTANNYAMEHLCWFVPEYSVLWNPFVGPLRELASGERIVLGYEAVVFLLLAVPLLLRLSAQLRVRVAALLPAQGWRW